MRKVQAVLICAIAVIGSLIDPAQSSDDYPNRPIRVINASSAGGASDIFVRALSDELQKSLKQPLVIENRPGGAFNIAIRACAEAAADGYTYCVLPGEALIFNPFLFKNLPYDPDASIHPVMNLYYNPQVLAISAGMGVKTIEDLVSLSKTKPKTLSYASPAMAQTAFIETYINKQRGADLVRVPFRGGGEVANGMLTGATSVAFVGIANLMGLLDARKVVGLAVDTDERIPSLPDVPTVRELGYSGPMIVAFNALFAPANTPQTLTTVIEKEISRILSDPPFIMRALTDRFLLRAPGSSAEVRDLIAVGRQIAPKIIEDSGMKQE